MLANSDFVIDDLIWSFIGESVSVFMLLCDVFEIVGFLCFMKRGLPVQRPINQNYMPTRAIKLCSESISITFNCYDK